MVVETVYDCASMVASQSQASTSHGQVEVWEPPPSGWVKLNSDGARHKGTGRTACGGVIRNSNRQWVMGYSRAIGICSFFDAELWGFGREWLVGNTSYPDSVIVDGLAKLVSNVWTGTLYFQQPPVSVAEFYQQESSDNRSAASIGTAH
ncbi:hypothetical protein F3Y22_tig00110328pilonHSYRG00785 [Hibiscus syriacus]|uniref:RNase H type-1 domain-containing protein n=1 Tax=Hibiscus syriacus TaxID=106335 RepID=A0A6A3B123_HIBSY|nr:hypothetical protein F3Y22_tig00110328pilonHSYRG00785 [Hibiscus syriacus]